MVFTIVLVMNWRRRNRHICHMSDQGIRGLRSTAFREHHWRYERARSPSGRSPTTAGADRRGAARRGRRTGRPRARQAARAAREHGALAPRHPRATRASSRRRPAQNGSPGPAADAATGVRPEAKAVPAATSTGCSRPILTGTSWRRWTAAASAPPRRGQGVGPVPRSPARRPWCASTTSAGGRPRWPGCSTSEGFAAEPAGGRDPHAPLPLQGSRRDESGDRLQRPPWA